MKDESVQSGPNDLGETAAGRPMVFPRGFLLAMVAMGYFPFLHAAGVVTLFVLAGVWSTKVYLPCAFALLYLVPPIVVRVFTMAAPLPEGKFEVNSRVFLRWWFTAQWQIVFNRLRVLEEVLRLVPGLYSLWLRIWGARVGRLVCWSPGLEVLDRSLLDVGDQVVFGIGVRLNPHVLMPDPETRQTVLQIGRIALGARSMIGGYSLVLAGVRVAAGEQTPAMRPLLAFTQFLGGRREEK
jgi:hypothetical protein